MTSWYGEQLEDTNAMRRVRQWENQKMRDIEAKSAELSNADPSALDTWTAAFSLYNPITSYIVQQPLPDVPYVEGYNPVDDIDGYERYWPTFVDSHNPETTAVLKQRIDSQNRNREIIANASTVSAVASTVGAGFSDVTNLALMLMPGALPARGAAIMRTAAKTAAAGAVATGASEAMLYGTQETRELEESITNLAATATVDAILGGGAAAWLGRQQTKQLTESVRQHFTGELQSKNLSAAITTGTATGNELKETTAFFKYTGLGYLGRQAVKINPLGRLATNESREVRALVQEMAEFTMQVEGDYLPTAVESLIKADLRATDGAIFNGRALQKKSGMSPEDFSIAVSEAQRRGDMSSNPQVQELAQTLRKHTDASWERAAQARIKGSFREIAEFTDADGNVKRIPVDDLKGARGRKILEKSEIVIEPIKSNTAQSHLRRMYDINKVRQDPTGFREAWKAGLLDRAKRNRTNAEDRLAEYLAGGDVQKSRVKELQKEIRELPSPEDLDEAVIGIDEKVRNLRPGDIHGQVVAPGSGMFKDRVDILDEFVEDYLVKDWELLFEQHQKTLSSRTHMAERFGQGDGDFMMEGVFNTLEESVGAQRIALEEAGELEAAQALIKNKDKAMRDLRYTRDSLLGMLHTASYGDERNILTTSALRTARNWNVATKLNSVLTASIPDMARAVTYNGGKNFAPALQKSLRALPLDKLPDNEMAALASASERVSSYRLQQYSDVDDALPYTKVEKFAHYISDRAMTISGIKHWNAMQKGVVGSMANNRIVRAMKDGEDIPWLLSVGFDEQTAHVIKRNINKHATFEDKLWNMNLDRWDSMDAIEAVEAAVVKEADRVVLTPGVGDRPIFMSTEAGATIFQFKSFIAASMNRLVYPLMQEQGGRKWAEIYALMAMGSFTYYLREKLAGREPSSDPAVIIREGIDRSGLAGYSLELYNMINKLAGHPFGDVPARYRSRDVMGALFGPSVGTISEVGKAVNVNSSPDSRVHAARKLLPLQNHFLLARPLTVLEGEAAKAMGGTGRYAEPQNIGTATESPPTF